MGRSCWRGGTVVALLPCTRMHSGPGCLPFATAGLQLKARLVSYSTLGFTCGFCAPPNHHTTPFRDIGARPSRINGRSTSLVSSILLKQWSKATMARFALLAVACLSSALGFIAPRPHTAACKQRLATPPRGTVVASLGASDVLVALGEESGLPDPTGAVVAFAFLFAAFAYTQFDMVGVTDQEELEGAEGARRARDALARKRGYFRK